MNDLPWTREHVRQLLRRASHAAADSQPPAKRLGLARVLVQREEGDDRLSLEPISKEAWQGLEELKERFAEELRFADSCLADDLPRRRLAFLLANSSELRRTAILHRYLDKAVAFRLSEPTQGLRISDDLMTWTQEDPSSSVVAIRARVFMERGNFFRILGQLDKAHHALAHALQEMEHYGTGDPLERARYLEILGTVEKDCGDFESAVRLLRMAVWKVRRWGDPHSLQRVLVASSLAEVYNGNFEQAHALLDESLTIDEPDSLLLQYAAVNKILAYSFSGQPEEAYQSLLRVKAGLGSSWLLEFAPHQRMRVLWIEAQIMSELRMDDAIPILKQVRDFYIHASRGYEACLVSIELALDHAAHGRFQEIPGELAFALPFLTSHKALDRYARAAVLLLQAALESQGRLEAEQLRVVAYRLHSFSRAPLSSHRPPLTDLPL